MSDQKLYSDPKVIEGRIGTHTSTYKVIRFNRMITRNENRGHGRKHMVPDAEYECQCTIDPSHPTFTRTGLQIDKGTITGCKACKKLNNQKRIHYNTTSKYIGETIGGAYCIRETDEINDAGVVYEWRCPFCGNTFTSPVAFVKKKALKGYQVDCGCQSKKIRKEAMINSSRGRQGIYSKDDPIKQRKAQAASTIIRKTTDPRHKDWSDNGGRTYGRPIGLSDEWMTNGSGDSVAIFNWLEAAGWNPDDGRKVTCRNINGDFGPDNCILSTQQEIEDNQFDTNCIQYGIGFAAKVYVGSKARALVGYSVSTFAYNNATQGNRVKLGMHIYKRTHSGAAIVHESNGMRDTHGYYPIIPKAVIFPRYPDDYEPPVGSYEEYLRRLAYNMIYGIPTRIFRGWVTDKEMHDCGIDPTSDRIMWLEKGHGYTHSELKPYSTWKGGF